MGLPFPGWGNGAFHLMFLSAAHVVGALFSEETPVPAAPRNAGQSSAEIAPAHAMTAIVTPSIFAFIGFLLQLSQDSR